MKNVLYENKTSPYYANSQRILGQTPHLHKELELVYVASGECTAYADRAHFPLKAGDVFISFPNQIHYYDNCTPGTYYVLIFSAAPFLTLKSTFNEYIPENSVIHFDASTDIHNFCEQALKNWNQLNETALAGYTFLIMSEVMPRLSLKKKLQTDNSTLRGIMNFCTLHFTEALTLDTVAEGLHLSKYYISRLLNRKLSLNFNDYINTLRIDCACELLEESDKKIADISEDVGFGSIRSFNRAFLRLMNMTPLQYRELRRNQSSDLR